MTIIWSDRALADFGEITSYNARFSATSSVRLSLAIADRLDKLDDHPGQGRMIPEVGNEQFREVSSRDTASGIGSGVRMRN